MKTDEQAESSRRLEEYRIRNEKPAEPIELEGWEELSTINRIQEIFTRKPERAKRLLK